MKAQINGKLVEVSDGVMAQVQAVWNAPDRVLPRRRVGAPREFLHLFDESEKLAFFAAAKQSAQLQVWWAEASTGDFSLDHPNVAIGLAILVDAGILTSSRSEAILGADFNSAE